MKKWQIISLIMIGIVFVAGHVFAQTSNPDYYDNSQPQQYPIQGPTLPAPSQSYSVLQQGPSVKAPWSPGARRAVNQMWQMIAQREAECPGSTGINPQVLAQHGIVVPQTKQPFIQEDVTPEDESDFSNYPYSQTPAPQQLAKPNSDTTNNAQQDTWR